MVFTKTVAIKSATGSWSVNHSIYCSSTIFPYQALERRKAQETLTGCDRSTELVWDDNEIADGHKR
jgi:hypothetical protein